MRRRYRLLTFKKGGREYLSLVVEYQDEHGAWHSKVVKSYGQNVPAVLARAQADLEELGHFAGGDSDPVPTGTVDEVIWASFYQTVANPLAMLPFIPLGVARDLSHLVASVISSFTGDLEAQVDATQPTMGPWERNQFLSWLGRQSQDDQRAILAYQWRYHP